MPVGQLLLAFIVAAALVAAVSFLVRPRVPRAGLLYLMLLVLLALWAGRLWARPFSPAVYGLYWMPLLMAALAVLLFWLALFPPGAGRRLRNEMLGDAGQSGGAAPRGMPRSRAEGYWLLLLSLLLALLAVYGSALSA